MVVLFAQTPRFRSPTVLLTFDLLRLFLPPSPAGRCCKQLPGPQPAGWGRFRSVTLSPAHLRSAAAPNGPGVGGARTERLHLDTHTPEADVHTRCFYVTFGFAFIFILVVQPVRLFSTQVLTLTFGSIEFVATDGHQINLPVGDVDGNLSNSLSSISVEENSLRATNPTCGKKGKCLIAPGFWSEN